MQFTPSIIKNIYQGMSSVRIRRSAMAPFLWASLFISIPCVIFGAFCSPDYARLVLLVGTIPLGLFVFVALFLLFFDRERLHTEEHLERMHAMEIVESKSQGIMLDPADLVNIINPEADRKQLPSVSESGKE